MSEQIGLFTGGREQRAEPDLPPPIEPQLRSRGSYQPSKELRDAVDVALLLGMPLLLTGEPGTGKTTLASALAHERFGGRLLEMQVKSDTGRGDLLYRVDELARFRDAQQKRTRRLLDYVEWQPLGEAILRACGPDHQLRDRSGRELTGMEGFLADVFGPEHKGVPTVRDLLGAKLRHDRAERWVVMIDEIDKAPRDTPNDLLEEFERMGFAMPELQLSVRPPETVDRPVVVVTSNSEKSLPDAFLRRCAFHHIKFPEPDDLRRIIRSRLAPLAMPAGRLTELIHLFSRLRQTLQRKPGTAELLQWLHCIDQNQAVRTGTREACAAALRGYVCLVAKSELDADRARVTLQEWAEARGAA